MAQPVATSHTVIAAPDDLVSELAVPIALVPMLNHRQQLGGFLALAGELTLHKDWENSPVDPISVFRDLLRHHFMSVTDPDTALMHRSAFVEAATSWVKAHVDPSEASQLLIVEFDSLIDVEIAGGYDAAREALFECMALLETRLRNRDAVGRVSRYAIAVLLKQCTEDMGRSVSDALMDSLSRHRFSWNSQIYPTHCRMTRHRLTPEKNIEALLPSIEIAPRTLSGADSLAMSSSNNVISIVNDNTVAAERCYSACSVENLPETNLRAQPGVLLQDTEIVACYRLRVLGEVRDDNGDAMGDLSLCYAALTQIAEAMSLRQRSLLPVLIVDAPGAFIEEAKLEWLLTQCIELRVPMSTFCLAFTEMEIMSRLRTALPVMKRAHREGVQLMLKAPGESPYAYHMQKLLPLDYVELLPAMVQSALSDDFDRSILNAQIAVAHSLGLQVITTNLDSMQLIKFCNSVGIDIGFGKLCGRSVSLSGLGMDNLSNG
jgi:EAL domain-containing protein (putative c-di-GMP-specific phosphodiesterase class I)/GGDEF domain-containing protein